MTTQVHFAHSAVEVGGSAMARRLGDCQAREHRHPRRLSHGAAISHPAECAAGGAAVGGAACLAVLVQTSEWKQPQRTLVELK